MANELKLANALVHGKLELLCTKMQLLSCPQNQNSLLEGTGVIRADEQGRISFKMVAVTDRTPDLAYKIEERVHGEVPRLTDLVMLKATDHKGNEWTSNPILPKLSPATLPSRNWIATDSLEQIIHIAPRKYPAKYSEGRIYIPQQRLHTFDQATHTKTMVSDREIGLSISANHHTEKIGTAEVEFRSEEPDWLVVRATQDTPIMPDWPGLICQGLSLATASTVRPAIAVREFNDRTDIGLFSGPFEFRSHLTPPQVEMSPRTAKDFWMTVKATTEWAMSDSVSATALFEELAGIRSGATGSIHTATLTLAIGIESIVGVLLKNEPLQLDETESQHIVSIIEHVKQWEKNPAILKRALGSLSSLTEPRAADRLHAFAKRVHIPDALIRDWKKLRNMKAHGNT